MLAIAVFLGVFLMVVMGFVVYAFWHVLHCQECQDDLVGR